MKQNYKNMTKHELETIRAIYLNKLKQIREIEENKIQFNSLTVKQKQWLLDKKIDLTIEIQEIDACL